MLLVKTVELGNQSDEHQQQDSRNANDTNAVLLSLSLSLSQISILGSNPALNPALEDLNLCVSQNAAGLTRREYALSGCHRRAKRGSGVADEQSYSTGSDLAMC